MATNTDEIQHESRGSVVLLVDDRFTQSLSSEITRLEMDLIGDGWNVIRQNVDVATATPLGLQQDIRDYYQTYELDASKKVKSVLLLGHIPAPKSGFADPGGHDTYQALPADAFYGDVDGIWTDEVDYPDLTAYNLPRNVAGDGVFDPGYAVDQDAHITNPDIRAMMSAWRTSNYPQYSQYTVPGFPGNGKIELSVGRIDMFATALIDPDSTYTSMGNWQTYTIDAGKHYEGTYAFTSGEELFNYLTFIVGDSQFGNPANQRLGSVGSVSKFRGLKLINQSTGHEIELNFEDDLVFLAGREEYGQLRDGIDSSSNPVSFNSNNELIMASQKNSWKVAQLSSSNTLASRYSQAIIDEFIDGGEFRVTPSTTLEIQYSFNPDAGDLNPTLPDLVAMGFDKQDLVVDGREVINEHNSFRIHALVGTPWGHAVDVEYETDLLRDYLDKDHAFRHGDMAIENRALIDDVLVTEKSRENAYAMFGFDGTDAQWHNTSDTSNPLFSNNWTDIDWNVNSALWGFGGGSGNTWSSGQFNTGNAVEVLSTTYLQANTSNSVFNKMLMSWGFNWDRSDSLLTSIIADEGAGLVSLWSNSLLTGSNDRDTELDVRNMGVGQTIGQANLADQNAPNSSAVYQSLIGDPTLRLHALASPRQVLVTDVGSGKTRISWTPSAHDDSNGGTVPADYPGQFLGYHVYRADSLTGEYARVVDNDDVDLFTGTYVDISGADPDDVYMVRAVKREDIVGGAYTNLSQGAFSNQLVVSVPDDELDGTFNPADLSLREAIDKANGLVGPVGISFADNLFTSGPATITLTYDGPDAGTIPDDLAPDGNVTIVGPGAHLLSISGNGQVGLFDVDSNDSLVLEGLTLKDGGGGFGGAINSLGSLTLDRVRITSSTAQEGGGVYQAGGELTITNSTIDDNQAYYLGGGISINDDSNALIANTTISGNSATYSGGGIYLDGSDAVVVNSTIIDNSTIGWDGAGTYVTGGHMQLYNSIVAENNGLSDVWQVSGNYYGSSNNLLGVENGYLMYYGVNNQVNVTNLEYEALAETFDGLLTHRVTDSRIINAGDNDFAEDYELLFDQRGFGRILDGTVDIGAVELAFDEF